MNSSLKSDFEELCSRLRQGRELGPAGVEPVYYLVFHPREVLQIKQQTPAWMAKLHQDGWDITRFSIAEEILDLLQQDKRRKFWLKADPLDWDKTNESLSNALVQSSALQNRLEAKLQELEGKPGSLLLVTDLEALHPYMRIGAIESQLIGKFHVPTVFLYPGIRTGKTVLRFLGFYPEDGNYRSVHIGG